MNTTRRAIVLALLLGGLAGAAQSDEQKPTAVPAGQAAAADPFGGPYKPTTVAEGLAQQDLQPIYDRMARALVYRDEAGYRQLLESVVARGFTAQDPSGKVVSRVDFLAARLQEGRLQWEAAVYDKVPRGQRVIKRQVSAQATIHRLTLDGDSATVFAEESVTRAHEIGRRPNQPTEAANIVTVVQAKDHWRKTVAGWQWLRRDILNTFAKGSTAVFSKDAKPTSTTP